MAVAARRLPGIRVEVLPPPAAEALPRMDVAVLVGFASTGPLHIPVAVESVAQYAAVFGADAPLAWDDERGERVLAHLGAAVRAFFGNGGRRCWVIRVARVLALPGAAAARANVFALPGVLELDTGGRLHAAAAQARCEGSWSDALRVASALVGRSFAVDVTAGSSAAADRIAFHTRHGLRAGDLVVFDDAAGSSAYAGIDTVSVASHAGGPYEVEATLLAAFEELLAPGSSPATPQPGLAQVAGFGPAVAATLVAPGDATPRAQIRFDAPLPATLEAGHWARWSDGAGETVWLRIDDLQRRAAFDGSPGTYDSAHIEAVASGRAWRELGVALPFPATAIRRMHVVTLDLRADQALGPAFRLNPVGLTPQHAQAFWTQSTDADFHRDGDDAGAAPAPQAPPSEQPRFPLARIDAPPARTDASPPDADAGQPRAWLPLGVEPLFRTALAPQPDALTALERDGLSQFDASLFVDPDLAGVDVSAIAALADAIRYIAPTTRPLRGLHAAWSIGAGGLFNEASLIAIPDAVHLGWGRRPPADVAAARPKPAPPPPGWTTHRGRCAKSATEPLSEPDFGAFIDCATRVLAAPLLSGPAATVPPGAYRLQWEPTEPGARYVLREAAQPDFGDAREIVSDDATEYVAVAPREGVYYYQVRAEIGADTSPGSNVVTVVVRADAWVQATPDKVGTALEGEWLAVHRAVLRMAAAGGELFAVLAMPRHFRAQQAIRYAARLRAVRRPPGLAEPDAFGFIERRVLSYGAIYLPWLQADARTTRDRGEAVAGPLPSRPRVVPPDGVALGILAARAAARGAWIAAANEPMKDVLALTPPIPPADRQALQDAQLNLLRADPRGFIALSADTLALDTDLRPINVRRLLILLRRLALRRGNSYVFEPSGPALRRAVERGFDTLMAGLFRRGAFAGRTPAQSYRVVTDHTINTPADADAGRFIVELRVAPSIPMRFVAVQLAQSGARLTVSEEL